MRRLFSTVPIILAVFLLITASPQFNNGQWAMKWVYAAVVTLGLELIGLGLNALERDNG